MLKTRSDALIVFDINTAAGGSIVSISNSAGWAVSSTILNSANWVVNVANTGGVISILNSGGLFANQSGTWTVGISNSAGWIINQANTGGVSTILNSGGLYAMQSGAWNISSTILNSAGWIVNVANTGGVVSILNSGGLFANQSGNWIVTIANTGGTVLSQTIANTAGWIVSVSNTGGLATVQNSGGLYAQQSGTWTVGLSNSAGWVFSQSNTAGQTTYIVNSLGAAVVTGYDTQQIYDGTSSIRMQYATISVGNSGNNIIVKALSSLRIRVISLFLISTGNSTVFWQSDSSSATNLTGPTFLAANVGYVLPFHPNGWFQTGTSTLLNLSCATVNSIGGCITYIQTS